MNSEQNQIHLIKAIITLKKIAITVRFPCSISFALKHQSNIVDHKAVYQLVKGQCIIDRTIEIEVEVPWVLGRYEQRKASLLIYMVSSNGKIPAGSVTVNPTQKHIVDKKAALEKCPDKNAYAVYTSTFERLRKIRNTQNKKLLNLASSTVSGFNQIRSGNIYPMTLNTQQQKHSQKNPHSPRFQIEIDNKYRSSSRQQMRQSVGTSSEKRINQKPPSLRLDLGRKSSYGSINKQSQQKQSRRSHKQVDDNEWTIKQASSRLKGSMARAQQERLELEQQIYNMNNQKDQLEDQIQNLRQKNRFQQRRETQSNSLMKQLREQLDKKKSRIVLLDSSKVQIQEQLSEKDKIIHDLQSQKKKIAQSLQQEKLLQKSQQKKLEIKENSFKEQLKKQNDKMGQIDTQRQKAILNYSELLNQFQASEKKHQISMREKQKAYNEEKGRLSKRIDQLVTENISLKQKVGEDSIVIREYQSQNKKLAQEQKGLIEKMSALSAQNQRINAEVSSVVEQRKKLRSQLAALQQSYSNQKSILKKKVLQLSAETQALKEKLQKATAFNANHQTKYKDLSAKLTAQCKQKALLMAELQSTKRMHEKYMQQQQLKQKLAQTLSVHNLSYNQKLNEYRNRVDLQRKKYETMEARYQEQVKYLIGSKQLIQTEMQQLRWSFEKEQQKCQVLAIKNAQLGQLGQRLIDVNQQIIVFQERFNTCQQQKEQLNKRIANLLSEIEDYQHKMRLHQDTLQKKQLEGSKIQRRNQQLEQDHNNLHQRYLATQANYKQKVQDLSRKIQQKANKIKNQDEEMQALRQQLSTCKHQLSKFNTQITHQNHQIGSLKQANKSLKRDYHLVNSKLESISEQERQSKKKLAKNEQALQSTSQQLQNCNRLLQKNKSQFTEYKLSMSKSLEQFLQFISREQFGQKAQLPLLCSLPDDTLFRMQVDSLKKYQTVRRQIQSHAEQYKNQCSQLRDELVKLQGINQKMQDQIMLKIKMLQDEINEQQEEKRKIVDEYEARIHELNIHMEQSRNEIEFLNNEINGYESTISQLNEQISKVKSKESLSIGQIRQLQQKIFEYKQKEMKDRLLSSEEVLDCQQILKLERQHNQELVSNLKAEIKEKEKQIVDKNEELKKVFVKQEQLQLQYVKFTHQIQNLKRQMQVLQGGKLAAQSQVREKEKMIAQLNQRLVESKQREEQQKSKLLIKQQSINSLQGQIQELQQQIYDYKCESANKTINISEEVSRQKEKRQKIESLRARLQQQNKQLRQKCIVLQSQNGFYEFYKQQSSRKIEEYERMKEQHMVDTNKYKQLLMKLQLQRQGYQKKYYQLEIDLQNANREKDLLIQSNNKIRDRITEYQQKCRQLHRTISELQSKEKQIGRLQQTNKSIQSQHDRIISQLRQSTHKLKSQISSKNIRIKELQQLLGNKEIELNSQKQKWQVELDNEKNIFQLKLQSLDDKICQLQNQLQFQRTQSVKEVEGSNAYIQELNEVVREKEEMIEYKEEIINEQNVRLEELNIQLNECITKWDKEKQNYLPNSTQITEIKDEIERMNKFINDLDGRNKQLLQINKRKVQQTIENKSSLTDTLKELLLLLHKSKSKILSRCQIQKQKEAIMLEFKTIQEKIDLTLKSTQIVSLKRS